MNRDQDIIPEMTTQKQNTVALQEDLFNSFMQSATDMFLLFDSDFNLIMANKSSEKILPLTIKDAMNKNILEISPSVKESGRYYLYRKVMETGEALALDNVVSSIYGDIDMNVRAFKVGDGLGIIATDISERKQMEKKLRNFQRRLRSLTSKLTQTGEQERRQLAIGLHDQITQPLAVIKVMLGKMRQKKYDSTTAEQIEEISQLLNQVIKDIRSLTFACSPSVLYELGLEAAIEWLIEDFQKRNHIHCEFESDGHAESVETNISSVLYRSVRELLTNVAKHAEASEVKVSIARSESTINISVIDNGIGLIPSEREDKTDCFGLFSIQEELTFINGCMEIESHSNSGSSIVIKVPLKKTAKTIG